jgi:hypothetical protein
MKYKITNIANDLYINNRSFTDPSIVYTFFLNTSNRIDQNILVYDFQN